MHECNTSPVEATAHIDYETKMILFIVDRMSKAPLTLAAVFSDNTVSIHLMIMLYLFFFQPVHGKMGVLFQT